MHLPHAKVCCYGEENASLMRDTTGMVVLIAPSSGALKVNQAVSALNDTDHL